MTQVTERILTIKYPFKSVEEHMTDVLGPGDTRRIERNDNDEVHSLEMKLADARELIDMMPIDENETFDEFTLAMDEAQGQLHSKAVDVAYVVIKLTR